VSLRSKMRLDELTADIETDSGECYCGIQLPPETSDDCHMRCSGDLMQVCGGLGALSTYSSLNTTSGPVANPGVRNWEYLGCYADSRERLLLHQEVKAMDNATVASCMDACGLRGFSLAGVEYGNECFCGNGTPDTSLPIVSGCEMTCNGNRSELCGGADRLNMYKKSKKPKAPLIVEELLSDVPDLSSITATGNVLPITSASLPPSTKRAQWP
jgi:hypothetical protein